jgi:hypothetical protein
MFKIGIRRTGENARIAARDLHLIELPYRARAFGQYWAGDVPLDLFDPIHGTVAETDFRIHQIAELPQRHVIARQGRGEICDDGFRFAWSNVATFDVRALRQIGYFTNVGWRGTLPDAFFSTVAALSLADLGMLPMHASAIEFNGRAFLFAGTAGAGKSTLTAELLAHGARFIGDDLTVIRPPNGDEGFRVTRGRPSMRLHSDTAALVDAKNREEVPDDPRGKLLIWPKARADDVEYPLAGIFVLEPGPTVIRPGEALRLLPLHLFRPGWMSRMSGHGQRRAWLIELAANVSVRRLPVIANFDTKARHIRAQVILLMIAG